MAKAKETSKDKPAAKAEPKKEIVKKEDPKVIDTQDNKPEKSTAKAGKRSQKAIKEVEQKQAKEEKKKKPEREDNASSTPKRTIKPPRTRLEKRSKKYKQSYSLIEKDKVYSIDEAVSLVEKTSTTKFDSTVELHVRLGVDPRQADQNVRATVGLPAGTGKKLKVAVFADSASIEASKKAGADIAEADEFLARLEKGQTEFDILISTPANMAKLGKHAKLLGPKGLMPNPKSGTVTNDIVKAVKEAKAGRLEYRVDSTGIIHAPVGKVSFGSEKLLQNLAALISSIKSNKPSSVKGNYILSAYLTTTMGPSIRIDIVKS